MPKENKKATRKKVTNKKKTHTKNNTAKKNNINEGGVINKDIKQTLFSKIWSSMKSIKFNICRS